MRMLLSPFMKTVKSIPRWQSLARHTTDRRWRAFDKKIKTGKVFGTHRNKQKSRICLMLLPCSLQLDLTGQKVIFGITPQLLLLLACSQTWATPCPTCTRKTAGGGPSQSKGISWANVMHSHPYCQPAQVPQDKQIPSGLPMQCSEMHLTHQGMAAWCPQLLCTNSANPEGQFIPQPAQGLWTTCLTHPTDPIATGGFHALPTATNSSTNSKYIKNPLTELWCRMQVSTCAPSKNLQ